MSRHHYSTEYKANAVRLMVRDGLSVTDVSQKLGVNERSLYQWKRQQEHLLQSLAPEAEASTNIYLNVTLARLLESRMIYAVDSEQLNRTRRHNQPGFELNFTCQGRGTLHVGTQAYPLVAGALVLIPEPTVHQLEVHTPNRYVRSVLCVAPTARDTRPFAQALRTLLSKPAFQKPRCLYINESSSLLVKNLIARIAAESQQRAGWWQEMVLAHAYELLALSARLSALPHPAQPPGNRLVSDAAAYVASHLDGDLSVAKVARQLGVSREHLSRAFHQHFGITYQRYVTNHRLEAARQLLTDTSAPASLLEIALATGFGSHAHFSRVFRKHEGVTPTQFRALHKARI
jgi:AraC-like DNA-binding protein/quercetin dioxygenase-like cupin family protein